MIRLTPAQLDFDRAFNTILNKHTKTQQERKARMTRRVRAALCCNRS